MLHWPFRVIVYGMLYVVWAMISLLILSALPSLTPLEAINVFPAGWIPIAAVFFVDLYRQLKSKRADRDAVSADGASPDSSAAPR